MDSPDRVFRSTPDPLFRHSPDCDFWGEVNLAHWRSKRHSWHLVCLSSMSMAEDQAGRLYPRRRLSAPCRLTWQERQIPGTTIDVSYSGLALSLPREAQLSMEGEVLIHMPDAITLRARPVYIHPQKTEVTRVGFEVATIE